MKQLLLVATFLVVGVCNAQEIQSIKSRFLQNQQKADSLQIEYPEVNEYLQKIEYLNDIKDYLLINENYKDKKKLNSTVEEYRIPLRLRTDINKMLTSEQKILDFYESESTRYYAKAYNILRSKILEYYEDNIRMNEIHLINGLRKGNYPVEKFNKLSNEEKGEVLDKIDGGYVYP